MSTFRSVLGAALLAAASLFSSFAHSATPALTTLYSFGASTDGYFPRGGLIEHNGLLYGTTLNGGSSVFGTVFSFDPASGAKTILHSFTQADGAHPYAALLFRDGRLYGTTSEGGASGAGTVFEVNVSSKAVRVVHSFSNADGTQCVSALILRNGSLMGTCRQGGPLNSGTVFGVQLSARSSQTLHAFAAGSDGNGPQSELIYVNGYLYGTTFSGGTADAGTIFRIDPGTGAEQVVYSFPGGSGGSGPSSGLAYGDGALYGNTFLGGTGDKGTVFRFDPATGSNTVLYRFAGGADGAQPTFETPLYFSGKLIGTTYGGGSTSDPYGFGTVYTIDTTTGAEQVIHRFTGGADGANPSGRLLYFNGKFYGVTMAGGTSNTGTLFAVSMQ